MIVKEIAPEAVIGQEYDYLHRYSAQKETLAHSYIKPLFVSITIAPRLLGQLAPADISEHIPGWTSQGQVPKLPFAS